MRYSGGGVYPLTGELKAPVRAAVVGGEHGVAFCEAAFGEKVYCKPVWESFGDEGLADVFVFFRLHQFFSFAPRRK